MVGQQRVVVLGASNKPQRYAYKALKALQQAGHEVIPVHPRLETIEGVAVVNGLANVEGRVDTLTLYVGEARSTPLIPEILALKPGRVIFNPGSESLLLQQALSDANIPWVHACTLVMLSADRF